MIRFLQSLALISILIFSVSCSSKKKNTRDYEKLQSSPEFIKLKENGMVQTLIIEDNFNVSKIEEADLRFSILEAKQDGHGLWVKVQYGGGCVDPHIFELKSNGEIDNRGNITFGLLHKTHDDLCKALLTKELLFDISKITMFNQNKIKSITVNNFESFAFKKYE